MNDGMNTDLIFGRFEQITVPAMAINIAPLPSNNEIASNQHLGS